MSLSKLFGNPKQAHKRVQIILIVSCIGMWLLLLLPYYKYHTEILLGMLSPLLLGLWTINGVTRVNKKIPQKVTDFMIKAFGIKMVVYPLYIIIFFVFSAFNRWAFVISFLGFFSVLHAWEAVYISYLLKQSQIQ